MYVQHHGQFNQFKQLERKERDAVRFKLLHIIVLAIQGWTAPRNCDNSPEILEATKKACKKLGWLVNGDMPKETFHFSLALSKWT
jgi:hypothetical protein